MNEYDIYKSIEYIIFVSYLIFIFLSIQIWFLWKNMDREEFRSKILVDNFFGKSYGYVAFSFSIFIVHEIIEETTLSRIVFFEFLEMIALVSLLIFSYEWYHKFKIYVHEKPIPDELIKL